MNETDEQAREAEKPLVEAEKDEAPAPDETQEAKDAAGNKTGSTPGAPIYPKIVSSTAAAPEATEEAKPNTAETTAAR